jgi:hypothetical protein
VANQGWGRSGRGGSKWVGWVAVEVIRTTYGEKGWWRRAAKFAVVLEVVAVAASVAVMLAVLLVSAMLAVLAVSVLVAEVA